MSNPSIFSSVKNLRYTVASYTYHVNHISIYGVLKNLANTIGCLYAHACIQAIQLDILVHRVAISLLLTCTFSESRVCIASGDVIMLTVGVYN